MPVVALISVRKSIGTERLVSHGFERAAMLLPKPSILLYLLVAVVMILMPHCFSHAGCFSRSIVSIVAIASMLTRVASFPGAARGLDMNSIAIASLCDVNDKAFAVVKKFRVTHRLNARLGQVAS